VVVPEIEPERTLRELSLGDKNRASNHSATVTGTKTLGQPGHMARARGDASFVSLEFVFNDLNEQT